MSSFENIVAMAIKFFNGDKTSEYSVSRDDYALLLFMALNLPGWVEYITTDLQGRVIAHEKEPTPDYPVGIWMSDGDTMVVLDTKKQQKDWYCKKYRWAFDSVGVE